MQNKQFVTWPKKNFSESSIFMALFCHSVHLRCLQISLQNWFWLYNLDVAIHLACMILLSNYLGQIHCHQWLFRETWVTLILFAMILETSWNLNLSDMERLFISYLTLLHSECLELKFVLAILSVVRLDSVFSCDVGLKWSGIAASLLLLLLRNTYLRTLYMLQNLLHSARSLRISDKAFTEKSATSS